MHKRTSLAVSPSLASLSPLAASKGPVPAGGGGFRNKKGSLLSNRGFEAVHSEMPPKDLIDANPNVRMLRGGRSPSLTKLGSVPGSVNVKPRLSPKENPLLNFKKGPYQYNSFRKRLSQPPPEDSDPATGEGILQKLIMEQISMLQKEQQVPAGNQSQSAATDVTRMNGHPLSGNPSSLSIFQHENPDFQGVHQLPNSSTNPASPFMGQSPLSSGANFIPKQSSFRPPFPVNNFDQLDNWQIREESWAKGDTTEGTTSPIGPHHRHMIDVSSRGLLSNRFLKSGQVGQVGHMVNHFTQDRPNLNQQIKAEADADSDFNKNKFYMPKFYSNMKGSAKKSPRKSKDDLLLVQDSKDDDDPIMILNERNSQKVDTEPGPPPEELAERENSTIIRLKEQIKEITTPSLLDEESIKTSNQKHLTITRVLEQNLGPNHEQFLEAIQNENLESPGLPKYMIENNSFDQRKRTLPRKSELPKVQHVLELNIQQSEPPRKSAPPKRKETQITEQSAPLSDPSSIGAVNSQFNNFKQYVRSPGYIKHQNSFNSSIASPFPISRQMLTKNSNFQFTTMNTPSKQRRFSSVPKIQTKTPAKEKVDTPQGEYEPISHCYPNFQIQKQPSFIDYIMPAAIQYQHMLKDAYEKTKKEAEAISGKLQKQVKTHLLAAEGSPQQQHRLIKIEQENVKNTYSMYQQQDPKLSRINSKLHPISSHIMKTLPIGNEKSPRPVEISDSAEATHDDEFKLAGQKVSGKENRLQIMISDKVYEDVMILEELKERRRQNIAMLHEISRNHGVIKSVIQPSPPQELSEQKIDSNFSVSQNVMNPQQLPQAAKGFHRHQTQEISQGGAFYSNETPEKMDQVYTSPQRQPPMEEPADTATEIKNHSFLDNLVTRSNRSNVRSPVARTQKPKTELNKPLKLRTREGSQSKHLEAVINMPKHSATPMLDDERSNEASVDANSPSKQKEARSPGSNKVSISPTGGGRLSPKKRHIQSNFSKLGQTPKKNEDLHGLLQSDLKTHGQKPSLDVQKAQQIKRNKAQSELQGILTVRGSRESKKSERSDIIVDDRNHSQEQRVRGQKELMGETNSNFALNQMADLPQQQAATPLSMNFGIQISKQTGISDPFSNPLKKMELGENLLQGTQGQLNNIQLLNQGNSFVNDILFAENSGSLIQQLSLSPSPMQAGNPIYFNDEAGRVPSMMSQNPAPLKPKLPASFQFNRNSPSSGYNFKSQLPSGLPQSLSSNMQTTPQSGPLMTGPPHPAMQHIMTMRRPSGTNKDAAFQQIQLRYKNLTPAHKDITEGVIRTLKTKKMEQEKKVGNNRGVVRQRDALGNLILPFTNYDRRNQEQFDAEELKRQQKTEEVMDTYFGQWGGKNMGQDFDNDSREGGGLNQFVKNKNAIGPMVRRGPPTLEVFQGRNFSNNPTQKSEQESPQRTLNNDELATVGNTPLPLTSKQSANRIIKREDRRQSQLLAPKRVSQANSVMSSKREGREEFPLLNQREQATRKASFAGGPEVDTMKSSVIRDIE